jgi:hypothetical protein
MSDKHIDTLLDEFFQRYPDETVYIRRDRAFHRFEVGALGHPDQLDFHDHVDSLAHGVRSVWSQMGRYE